MVGQHHWLNGHEFELWELVMDREAWHAAVHRVTKSWHDWATELKWTVLISGFWRVSEIILWGLTQCLADNKQSINNRNCYRESFVHALFFLGKQLFIIERQVVSWHLLWPFYYWEKITSGPKSWLIYILCLWTAKLSPLWFSERNKGQWQGKFGFTAKWTLPEPSFG